MALNPHLYSATYQLCVKQELGLLEPQFPHQCKQGSLPQSPVPRLNGDKAPSTRRAPYGHELRACPWLLYRCFWRGDPPVLTPRAIVGAQGEGGDQGNATLRLFAMPFRGPAGSGACRVEGPPGLGCPPGVCGPSSAVVRGSVSSLRTGRPWTSSRCSPLLPRDILFFIFKKK